MSHKLHSIFNWLDTKSKRQYVIPGVDGSVTFHGKKHKFPFRLTRGERGAERLITLGGAAFAFLAIGSAAPAPFLLTLAVSKAFGLAAAGGTRQMIKAGLKATNPSP